ncbi:putative LysM domain-containing protein [Colletotrichum sublineola]|uniref:Putative LysM domain-containing protein n=1 Tax=Colletotrichum sublineola TaxID=1173701 RepID=A0A066WWJ7_COLSU|nr:putative LysM domain-containing protein [Colletotrichum sublineola]
MSLQILGGVAWLASLLLVVLGQVFVGSNSDESNLPLTLPAPGKISSQCNSTFSTRLTCDTTLPRMAYGGYFPETEELTHMCQTDCLQALESLRQAQTSQCADDVLMVDGQPALVTVSVDTMMWVYNYTCRRDAQTGDFCAPIFDAWASDNTTGQGKPNDQDDGSCSDCVLGTYQLQLGYAYGYDDELAARFSALTSSCGATGYPVTSPSAIYLTGNPASTTAAPTSTSPEPDKSCVSTYIVQASDADCHSIAVAQSVSLNQMLYYNNLQAGCADFPTAAGTQLCMPHTCKTYTVQQNDTCAGLVQQFEYAFTQSQLVAWNVDISRGCDNLALLVGAQICVSFPGDVASTTTTRPPQSATVAPIPTNVVDGTNTRCSRYYEIKLDDTCASVSTNQGIALQDFYFLNPELNTTSCSNLFLGYSYCVAAVGDITTYSGYHGGSGRPTNPCVGGTTMAEASSCYATTYKTTDAWTFPVLNHTASTTTKAASSWTSIPVTPVTPYPVNATRAVEPTPTPYQAHMASGCTDFYKVVEGTTCAAILNGFAITFADFYAWNPDVGDDCQFLQLGVYVCVSHDSMSAPTAMETTKTTSTTATSSSSSASAPPGPTQAGIPADCDKWILQQDGVYCYDMANNAGIDLACLYKLNPALNTDAGECQGLWRGYAYCVETKGGACS